MASSLTFALMQYEVMWQQATLHSLINTSKKSMKAQAVILL